MCEPPTIPTKLFATELAAVVVLFMGYSEVPWRSGALKEHCPLRLDDPGYHPATLLKIYIYGYLNRIQSSRRLERESQRNVELMWLTGRLSPDFKTIADFRRDNGPAIRQVCGQFVECRGMGLFENAVIVIDGSKFKAVNNRDKNFTPHKLKARQQQLEQSIGRYLTELGKPCAGGGKASV